MAGSAAGAGAPRRPPGDGTRSRAFAHRRSASARQATASERGSPHDTRRLPSSAREIEPEASESSWLKTRRARASGDRARCALRMGSWGGGQVGGSEGRERRDEPHARASTQCAACSDEGWAACRRGWGAYCMQWACGWGVMWGAARAAGRGGVEGWSQHPTAHFRTPFGWVHIVAEGSGVLVRAYART